MSAILEAQNPAADEIFASEDTQVTDLEALLGNLMNGGGDYGDLYFEFGRSESWQIEHGRVSTGGFMLRKGVGARSMEGTSVGFAYGSDLSRAGIGAVAGAAATLRRAGSGTQTSGRDVATLTPSERAHGLYEATDPVLAEEAPAKIAFLTSLDSFARQIDPSIVNLKATLSLHFREILVAATDGTLSWDRRPLVRLDVEVHAERNGRRVQGRAGGGGRFVLDRFTARAYKIVETAAGGALHAFEAGPAPSGEMQVVLGPGIPGMLFHEAVGHGLEADAHRKGVSVFAGMMGAQVAAPGVTVVDDGSIAERPGSFGIDDEGIAPQRNVLIENGRLVGLMSDRLEARLGNGAPTGNGRRQSFAHLPMPRMTNTFLANGKQDPLELIQSVRHGIYAANFGGGDVDTVTGRFSFSTTRAWLIENGRLTQPIVGATLTGNGMDALQAIDMIGNDLALDDGAAMCGKWGQDVPVSVGQPSLRLSRMLVGGTK